MSESATLPQSAEAPALTKSPSAEIFANSPGSRITTPFTPSNNDEILFINVNGPASVILPVINNEDKRAYYIKDYSGNSKISPITITAPATKTIDGVSFAKCILRCA